MAPLSLKIILEEGTVCRTILFNTTTTVQEAHEIVLEKFHNSVNQDRAYGLFLTSADDEKAGIWLESHRTLDYYMLRDGDSLHYLSKTRNLRIRMLDGSVKTLQVDESKVVGELLAQICSKIGITNHDEYGFCREYVSETEDTKPTTGTLTLKRKISKDKDVKLEQLSKKLNTDDNVEWLNQMNTLRELNVDPTETLLLKRRLFYSDRKIDARDPVQLNLLYVQTRDDILSGRQVTTEEKAVEFAGIQCQVHFGDYDEEKHKPGFIENLAEYLPKSYVSSWGIEKKIYKEYRKHVGVSQLDAKYLYTKIAREHPTYGVTFFLVKEQEKGKKKMVPRLLGINANSILRLDENTKEILKVWLLTQVKSYHAGKTTFTLNFGDYSDKEYAVKTNEAYRIRDILEGYIDIIRKKLEGPTKVLHDEGMVICEDNVEKSKGSIIQTVMAQKLSEHSLVGPQVIFHENGQESSQGTQIVTVQQILITKRGNMKQQATSGMTGCMPEDFNRRINHLNSQSVKAVMLLSDPSHDNLKQLRTITEDFEGELLEIEKGVQELANQQTSEEDKKRLLDELEQIRKYILDFNSSTKSSDFESPEKIEKAEEAAKKIAELSSLILLSSDPKIKRRSELLKRSRKSFIADERVEATLRRASFLTIASSASKAVGEAIEDLDTPYNGPPVSKEDAMKYKSSLADNLAKLNAAVALLLAARSDPNNVDYETAVNSLTTINELTPGFIQEAKALKSTVDGDKHLDLLSHINALCQSLNALCELAVSNNDSEIEKAAEKYSKHSNKLIYVFNPKGHGKSKNATDPDKANEIIDLAKKVRDKTSSILAVTMEMTKPIHCDPRAQALDDIGIKCADHALKLLTCSQITAPTIYEPHCQSALTAAGENFLSSVNQLTSSWKPLVEEQQFQKYGKQLDDKTSKLMKTLELLRKAYKNLEGDKEPEIQPKPDTKAKDKKQRLQFVTSLAAAKHSIAEMERELQETKKNLAGKPIKKAEKDRERLRLQLSKKLAQLNAAMASLVHATSDKENPDYVTAVAAIDTINDLNPQIIKDTKELCKYESEKTRKDMLEDIAAMCKATKGICAGAEHSNLQDMYNATSPFADSSGKLYYVFNRKANPDQENRILDLSRSACEKASEMLSKVYQLAEAVGGDDGAKLDSSGTNVVSAAQGLLAVAQITAPSIKDERCKSALITSADRVSNLTQDVVSLWEPIIRNPEHQTLGDDLNKDRESLEALLEKLKKACEADSAVDKKPELQPKPKDKKQRLQFVRSLAAAKHSIEEMERGLQETKKNLDGKPMKNSANDRERLRLQLSQKLAQLNAAMSSLVQAACDKENPDYETAVAAIDAINELNPQIIKDTTELCQYENEKTRKVMLEDILAMCKATQRICAGAEQSNLQDMYDAAAPFADSSGKLYYVFNRKANPDQENRILDLSRSACEKASEMLSKLYQLAEAVGGDDGTNLDSSGTNVVSAAQGLLTVAQITAPSIKDERCKSALITCADRVSNLTQDVASLWEPIIRNPEHQTLGDELNKDRESLEALLEKLKNACEADSVPEVEIVKPNQDKQRLNFIMLTKAAKKGLAEAEKLLLDSKDVVISQKLSKDIPEYKDLQLHTAQRLAELNAAVAALSRETADKSNMDYEKAESLVTIISQITPDIIENTNNLCQYADEKQRVAMLDSVRSLWKANKLICDSLENDDVQELNKALNKFTTSSGKLCYIFNPRANSMKENKILDLSREACESTSSMLSKVYELAEKVGGEEGLILDAAGAKVVDAAQVLLTTAQITAVSISDPRCQSELIRSADAVSSLTEELASIWTPIAQNPDHQVLKKDLDSDRKKLDIVLDKLKNACGVDKDTTDNAKHERDTLRIKFIQAASDAKKDLSDVEKILQENTETLMQANKLNKKTPEYKELQHISAQKLAELKAAIAALMKATSDTSNPDYKTAETAISTISHLTPEIAQNTSKLCEYEEESQRQAMLEHLKALCVANQLICEGMENNDFKSLHNAAKKYANCSDKLYYVFKPSLAGNSVKNNLLLDLSRAVHENTLGLLSHVDQLSKSVGGEDGSTLDTSAVKVANIAEELKTVTQITIPSIEDKKCQATLIDSAANLSSAIEELSSKWTRIVHDSKYADFEDKLNNFKKETNDMIKKLISECKSATKPKKPEPPKRQCAASLAESKQVTFCKLVDLVNNNIKMAEEDLKKVDDNISTRPIVVEAQEKLQNLIVNNLALAGVAVSHLISDMGSEHINYDSAVKATKVLAELIPVIVKDGKELSFTRGNTAKKELLDNMKTLCEVSTKLCDTAKNDTKNINEVAVEFGNKAAKLLYGVSAEINPEQEKEVIQRAREIGDSASRLAMRGAEGALEVKDARAHALCAAATRCANSASDFMYTAKLLAPTIQNPESQKALLDVSNQLDTNIKEYSLSWQPLYSNMEHESFVNDLDTEAKLLRSFLNNFNQDLKNEKFVKRRVVEKLVIQDTPLRQLASNILDTIKVKAELSDSPKEKRKLLDYYSKLAAAINDLDVANAKSRNAPGDQKCRGELEDAVLNLQQVCLESRIQSGEEKRFVDLMDLINDVSSDATKLAEETMNVKPEYNKYALVTIKSQAEDIVKSATEAAQPPEIRNEGEVIDGTSIIKQFAEKCDERVDIMHTAVEEIRDVPSQNNLRSKLNNLKGSSDLLRFAVNSHIAAVRSATLEANQADFEELEKNINNVLQSTRKIKNENNETDTTSAAMATATTLCSAVSSHNGLEKIPSALANYLLEIRSRSNLADAKQKLRLEEHLKKLLDLLKTHTMARGRQVATWQDVDSGEVAEITSQIIQEIENFSNEDSNGMNKKSDGEILNNSDLMKHLFQSTEGISDDLKQLNKRLQQQLEKLTSLAGTVQMELNKREPLRVLPRVAEAASELRSIARAIALSHPIQRSWIEDASDAISSTTYNFLKTAETANRHPRNRDSHRKFNEAWRLLNDSINKMGQLLKGQDKMKRDCSEIVRNLQLQLGVLQTDYPSNMMSYKACLEPLRNQNNLHSIQNENPMTRQECSNNLQYLSSMMCHSSELAAQCGYLLSLSDEDQHIAKEGFFNIPRVLNITGDIRLACLKIIRCKNLEEINYTQSNINKQVIELQEVVQDAAEKLEDPEAKRDLLTGLKDVDQEAKNLAEALGKNPSIETITRLAAKLLDATEDFTAIVSRVAVFPQVKLSADCKTRSDQVVKSAKTLLTKTQALVQTVASCDLEVLTWKMFDRDRSELVKSYEEFVECIVENGRKAGFIEGKVVEKVAEETNAEAAPKKSFIEIQYDLARKWLNKPASKQEDKSAGIQGVQNIIDLAEKMSEDMKGEEKVEIQSMVEETKNLLEDCSKKYNSEKASLLLERLRELQSMLKWRVVTRVVEDFLEEEPLADLDELTNSESDNQKRKYILDKKIADLLAQLGKMTRTARLVADAGSGISDRELMQTKDQMELLAPALVKAAQHRIADPNNKEAVETYRRYLAQYTESITKLREICDRSVDPMEFAQAAGETIQRIREEPTVKNDPQYGVNTSRAITRLGLRVIEAGMCSREAKNDPELKQALAQAQGRLAASTKQQQRASRAPNWKDITAEILQTTGEVESFLGGENIFQKQPEPDQPIYAAALDLHATVREWSARDNEIVAVAKRMAVQMARLSEYMNTERKCELLATSKDIVASSHQVAALARKLALECTDMRIRTNLIQVCEQIPTISGQLKMLITVKGSSMGSKGTQESREAMDTLVLNAQNLMSSIQEVVKAAIGASVKIMSQRGLRIKWVRRACYNY